MMQLSTNTGELGDDLQDDTLIALKFSGGRRRECEQNPTKDARKAPKQIVVKCVVRRVRHRMSMLHHLFELLAHAYSRFQLFFDLFLDRLIRVIGHFLQFPQPRSPNTWHHSVEKHAFDEFCIFAPEGVDPMLGAVGLNVFLD